jgi:hypothetical protein
MFSIFVAWFAAIVPLFRFSISHAQGPPQVSAEAAFDIIFQQRRLREPDAVSALPGECRRPSPGTTGLPSRRR